ncbi:MAG TPA: FAD binding domain-containing protein [Rectinema sp.]|jgi:CO/xanthine dehydrogenase FAD-binding subunit|nr:FAD binding domain-containing protein [Spirochaetia bacterium]HAL94275.1 hypothetical protein [Spirochaetaceae bacterium]HNV18043.1 FAD binding domain-containing protein [Rectinema sp.]HNY98434.1 FAD binding domain-containing protein [Rectinema sp.]HOD57765.1 FAD binding domain-containing protein [Rectinema sp.]
MNLSEIYYPHSVQELIVIMERQKNIQIVAGATSFGYIQEPRYLSFEPSIACIRNVPELKTIHKTERMISFGAACSLSELESVYPFEKNPAREVLRATANSAVRNIATIGGHLMYQKRFLALWPLLACLDTELEFKGPSGTSIKNIWYLTNEEGLPTLESRRILTRIRIPLQSIDYLFIRRTGGGIFPDGDGAYLVSACSIERNSISNFKLVIAGQRAYRDYDAEQKIVSSPYPLTERVFQSALRMYSESLLRTNFWNTELFVPLISQALDNLQRSSIL